MSRIPDPPPSPFRKSLQVPAHVIARLPLAQRSAAESAPAQPAENPRVQVHPSSNGTVLLVGMTIRGTWVAEHRCLTHRFSERHIRAMEREVIDEERRRGESTPIGIVP